MIETEDRRRGAEAAALALVLAVAAWARLSGFADVLGTGEFVPLDGDSAYHLRRMALAATSLPRVPAFDPWLSWPDGAFVPWADGFDLALAGVFRAAGGAGAPDRALIAAALVPVALGLLVVWAAADLARLSAGGGRAGTGAFAAAGLLAALLPQAVATSRLGRTDHHVVEALSMLLLAGWALRRWPAREGAGAARFELAGALASALAVWTFAGGTVYVGLVAAVLVGAALAAPAPRLVGSGAPGLLAGAVLALGLGWPAAAARGLRLEFAAPSLLQPLLLALGGASIAGAVRISRARSRSVGLLVAVGAGCALAAAVVLPALGRELRAGFVEFILRRDPWLAVIEEFQPLLAGGGVARLHHFYGVVGLAAPLLLTGGAWVAFKASRPRGVALAALLTALCALALLQVRFGRVLAPFLAAAAGLALAGAALALGRAWRAADRTVAALPLAAACAVALVDGRLQTQLRPKDAAPPSPLVAAALDLRGAPALEDAGVLAPWDLGHLASFLARAPVATSGFGSFVGARAFEEVESVLARGPDALDALLERRRLSVVIAGPATFRVPGPGGRGPFAMGPGGAFLDPDYLAAVPAAALLVGGSAMPAAGLRHVPHLMPRFASEQVVGGLPFALPMLWSFERVKGAVLRGRAPPGSRVLASVPLHERGRPHRWRAFTEADARGEWALTVPVPTDLALPTVSAGPRYEIRVADGPTVEIEVSESQIRNGAVLEVPALTLHEPAPRSPRSAR